MDRKLQVFVSSTFTDLISERQAAVSAILKAGHMPAGMELFTAGSKSQWDTITKWIDESDVYLLILGGRYGSIEPVSGLSYTELEYNYAVDKGKPFFAVVASDDALDAKVRAEGIKVAERDRPDLLKAFRAKVLSTMSSFFSDEKDIRLAVMESLMHISDVNSQAGWVRASTVLDTKTLDETIVRLREENIRLDDKVRRMAATAAGGLQDFATTKKILETTTVRMPDHLLGEGKPEEMSLLAISSVYLDTLVQGVRSNSVGDTTKWLRFRVLPKLTLHGLAVSEKVAGAQFTRSVLSPAGLKFFSQWKREMLL